MNPVLVVAGVPGVGASTLLHAASRATGLPVVPFGSEMLAVAQAQGLARHRDELRRLPPEKQAEVQRLAAESVRRRGACLVDTHLTVRTPQGYLPGLPQDLLEALRPARIVLVEAQPEEIHMRRLESEGRMHDDETAEEIEAEQALNRAAAMACAILVGSTVKIVFNHEGRQDAALRNLLEALRGVAPVPPPEPNPHGHGSPPDAPGEWA